MPAQAIWIPHLKDGSFCSTSLTWWCRWNSRHNLFQFRHRPGGGGVPLLSPITPTFHIWLCSEGTLSLQKTGIPACFIPDWDFTVHHFPTNPYLWHFWKSPLCIFNPVPQETNPLASNQRGGGNTLLSMHYTHSYYRSSFKLWRISPTKALAYILRNTCRNYLVVPVQCVLDMFSLGSIMLRSSPLDLSSQMYD